MAKPREIRVPEGGAVHLDQLIKELPGLGSRRKAQRAIAAGKVSVDGRPCGPGDVGFKVAPGARVEVDLARPGTAPDKVRAKAKLRAADLAILFEDEHLIAVDKPPGLLTDTATVAQARRRDSVRKRVRAYLRAHRQGAFVVHRIDRDTSGVVLLAKDEASSQALRDQFRARTPTRRYDLVVHGRVDEAEATWTDLMAWDAGRRIQRVVPADHPKAFRAIATMRRVAQHPHGARLEVSLTTGRRNQIRLQAMLRGHPLVGERLYVPEGWRPPDHPSLPRQALHARSLTVEHPATGEAVRFEAPWPDDFARLVASLERR